MMIKLLPIVVAVAFLPLAMCWGFWMLLALASLLPRRVVQASTIAESRVKIDVLIPAHNEEALLPKLLESIRGQTFSGALGRVLVVADHCSDATAEIARRWGADVLERGTGPRGKPAAVRDGLAYLTAAGSPGDAVLFVDSDCTISPNFLEHASAGLAAGYQVLQSVYILEEDGEAGLGNSVRLGFLLKNLLRPTGLAALHLPVQLFGAGMVFRREILGQITFGDYLAEDVQISHRLLAVGIYPHFIADARVVSPAVHDQEAITKQRLRWEGGQFEIWKSIPPLAFKLAIRARLRGLIVLLDWAAPPLAMAVMGWMFLTAITVVLALLHWAPLATLAVPVVPAIFLALYLVVGALSAGGPRALLQIVTTAPKFLFWKLALYANMLRGNRATSWDRTPRAPQVAPQPEPKVVE